ncbi:NADH-quinone oxidoreductase subunit L [Chloroflexota bacterium]
MIPDAAIIAIFLLPVFSFLVISLIIRPFFHHKYQYAGYTAIACIFGSLALSIWALSDVASLEEGEELAVHLFNWVEIGGLNLNLGFLVDNLTAIMLIVASGVSTLVQIYSQGYMKPKPVEEDPKREFSETGYCRYFAWMSLFTASMLGLVLASDLLLFYVFWEGVGLCSYLLIGFWFHKPSAAAAAKKAFLVTRLGDFGFLAAILALYFGADTINIAALNHMAGLPADDPHSLIALMGTTSLALVAIGIFAGAVGKSAQFPLHTWLPDAMEGPTPVSSLIHAATMVAAGVYLVARTLPIFAATETAVTTVAFIGGFTAIFAASMGLVMYDIKRVLAYSTISQLGYMILGLGLVGLAAQGDDGHGGHAAAGIAVAVGIFHLFTHAFFKCLLFLGAGSVSHATDTFDMRLMGGLRKVMPWTFVTFLIGSLSLAGIWPLAGFWSKEGILHEAWMEHRVLFVMAMITVFMTAFYMFRALFMTFGGTYRGDQHHLHESPRVMLFPMAVLALFGIGAGWGFFGVNGFLDGHDTGIFSIFTDASWLPWVSLLLGGSGIFLAYAIYSAGWISAESLGRATRPLHTALSRKYWFDELYEQVLVVRVFINGLFALFGWFDKYIVDGIVNGSAWFATTSGGAVRRLQSGQLQVYGIAILLGVLIIFACFHAFS